MSIYVHYSENSKTLKEYSQVYPGLVIFKEFHEIEPYVKSRSEIESFVCFTEDSLLIKQLSTYDHVFVIISESVFLCILNELIGKNHTHFNLLKGVVLTFSEFQEDDKIIILKAKAILMGARFTNNVSALTHVIPYRMSGSLISMIRELYKNVKIYDKFFIEYYWNNCLTILSPYRELNNELVENAFKGSLFMNCRIILLGFGDYYLDKIIDVINKNGGSIIELISVHEATHIIYPFYFLSNPDQHRQEFNSIPASLRKNMINDRWLELSLSIGCLLSLDNYQLINLPHVYPLNNIQPDNIVFQDVDDEIFDVHIEKDSIGYDPSLLTKAQIDDHNTQRLNNVKDLVNYFKDKYKFFNKFIFFLVSLETEYRSLQIVIEHFAGIVKFYRSMNDIFDIEIENIDNDTFIGMIANTDYSSIKGHHKKFIIYFEKIENLLKKTIKENVLLKEKIDEYLHIHKISYSADDLINIPIILLSRINLIIGEIMKHSPYCHLDMKYLKEMSDKTVEVVRYHSYLMTMDMENNKQVMISKCIDEPICSGGSQFVSVVDCMLIEDDGIRTSTSMFLFTDKIILSKIRDTKLSYKRFSDILTYLNRQNDDNGSLSRCKQKESKKTTSSNTEKSPFYSKDAIKFSTLFCGLSRLSLWGHSTPVLYNSNIVYQSRVVKVISYVGGPTLESKLYFTLNMAATENENEKQLKFLLVPRIVKDFSKYEKINTVFENDLPWDASDLSGINWEQFIVYEKLNFCELVARLFNGCVIEDYSKILSNPSKRITDSRMFKICERNTGMSRSETKDLFNTAQTNSGINALCENKEINSVVIIDSGNENIQSRAEHKFDNLIGNEDKKEESKASAISGPRLSAESTEDTEKMTEAVVSQSSRVRLVNEIKNS